MRKKESSKLDLLRFFPVWGKSVMDSIKKSMEDKTNSEEQVVTINIEENNENSMDGGKGKRGRKKVSRKKKGGAPQTPVSKKSYANAQRITATEEFRRELRNWSNEQNETPNKPRRPPTINQSMITVYPTNNLASRMRRESPHSPVHHRNPLPNHVNGQPLPNAGNGEPLPNPVNGQPLPNPVNGQPLPNPVNGQPLPNAGNGEPLPNPVNRPQKRGRNGNGNRSIEPSQHRARIENEENEDESTQVATQPATPGGKRKKKTKKSTKKKSTKRRSKK